MAFNISEHMSGELHAVREARRILGAEERKFHRLGGPGHPELEVAASSINPPELTWRRDPVEWTEQRAHMETWSKQRDIFRSVVAHSKTAVHSSHSVGKSYSAATVACWWLDVHPPGEAFVLTTAPTDVQVKAILWREINKLHAKLGLRGRTNLSEWYIGNELVALGRKPSEHNPTGLHGIHNRYFLVVIDEGCHDDQTEVMTEHGWRKFSELSGDERLMTMDPQTHRVGYRKPRRLIAYPYQGLMYEYRAKGANFCVTPDHRMYTRKRRPKTGDYAPWSKLDMEILADKQNHYMLKTAIWNAPDIENVTIPAYQGKRKFFPARTFPMDEWMTFLGWWFAEGSLIRNGDEVNGISITQKNAENFREILTVAQSLGLNPKTHNGVIHIHSRQLGWYFRRFADNCLNMAVPDYARMASVRQITLFLTAFMKGDGYRRESHAIMYTSSRQLADHLQEMVLKTGAPSVVTQRSLKGQTNWIVDHYATSTADGYVVSWPDRHSQIKYQPSNVREINYDGMVYCADIPPEHMLFTRRNGYTLWSGNCGVPKALWDAASTLVANEYGRMLAIGNPDDPQSEFARVCKPDSGWNVLHIGTDDTPNFTGEKVSRALSEMLPSRAWKEDRKKAWGEDSAIYISKVLGHFPEEDDPYTTVPFAWASRCRYTEFPEDDGDVQAGIDIGAGGDRTVIYERRGRVAGRVESFQDSDPMRTVGRLVQKINEWGVTKVKVDVIGIGWGLYGALRQLSSRHNPVGAKQGETTHAAEVIPVNFSTAPSQLMQKRFLNRRAEVWWNVGRENSRLQTWDLTQVDDDIIVELTAPRYEILDSQGKIKIEAKEHVKSRLGRSPDKADALLLAFYEPGFHASISSGMSGSSSMASTDLLRGLKPL